MVVLDILLLHDSKMLSGKKRKTWNAMKQRERDAGPNSAKQVRQHRSI